MGRLLVEAEHVSCGIAKPCGNLGRIPADGLHELAAVDNHGVNGRGHTVNPDVNEQSRPRPRLPAGHPRPTYFTRGVVECGVAVPALPDPPAENFGVEVARTLNVNRRYLDVADLAVGHCWGHQDSFGSLRSFPALRPSPSIRLTASRVS